MRRARLLVADLLLRGARALMGKEEPQELPVEDDEEDVFPVGHPVVTRSEEATSMLWAAEQAWRQPRPKEEPEPPLRGSLQDRINRRTL